MTELFDMQSLETLKTMIRDKLPSIVSVYLKNAEIYMASINSGLHSKNFNELAETAHMLKSSSGMLGMQRLFELCDDIEAMARTKNAEDFEKIAASVAELNDVYTLSVKKLEDEVASL